MGTVELVMVALMICGTHATLEDKTDRNINRESKLLPVFQVVRFPNDPCQVTGGAKNGTCYTQEECTSKGGINAGSCASGFGICCTFTIGCGSSASENCTYFEATNLKAGQCRSKICQCSSDICQFRLDFNSFVITGPNTVTTSITKQIGGFLGLARDIAVNFATQCLTDQFSVTNAANLPMICGTMTGEHVYFDATGGCHELAFAFGQTGVGNTIPTRTFSIKVTQYSCGYNNLAPSGCNQYFYGNSATGIMKSFNYDGGSHLADQRQVSCVRRESGNCKICWTADTLNDVQLSGTNAKAVKKQSSCCGYGADGKKTVGVYDCLIFPGAIKAADNAVLAASSQCGGKKGIASVTDGPSTTICSKAIPFRLEFYSDSFELAVAAITEGTTPGYKIRYFQGPC